MTQGFFKQPISLQTWQDKFQLKNKIGNNVDESIEDTFNRVATQLSYNAGEKEIFFKLLMENKFVPAGRILANIGAGYHKPGTSPINCIVSRMIPDSMEGIMQALKEAANVLQRGSGIGYDFSSIRPKGAIVNGVGAATSGPLSFMSIYDKMCKTIQSAGGRRGAQMGIMDCQHPDIEDFVVAKQTDGAYRQFNLSVNMTKNFINAVKDNADWDLWFWEKTDDTPPSDYEIKIVSKGALPFNYPEYTYFRFEEGFHHDCEFDIHTYLYKKKVYKTLKAVDLFNLITKSAYDYAEPGCLIVDNSNRLNNLWFLETLRATNPCSEQNLPPYGACLLGSLNLVQFCTFVDGKYVITEENKIDFKRSVRVANLMLHRVVPFANLPYLQHAEEINSKRRHGLGFTGLGSLLAMMNIKYDSQEALEIAEYFSKTLARESYLYGIELAETGDCAPVLSTMYPISGEIYTEIRNTFGELISSELVQNGYVKGSVLMALSKYLKNVLTTEELYSLAVNGCAYTHATSIAPAGTISLLSNNVSNGIEPIFSPVYERNVIDKKDGSKRIEPVMDYAYQLLSETGSTYMDIFKTTANTISVDAHIAMMEVVQKYIDSSISKTINIDTDYPFEDFKEVYLKCYNAGLKGVSVFRFNPNFSSGVLLDKNTLAKHDYEFTTKSGKVYKLNGAEKVMYKGKEFYAATLHTELKEKSI